jgi:hypothetical protein
MLYQPKNFTDRENSISILDPSKNFVADEGQQSNLPF